jgi:hypothetical protein
MNRGLDPAYSPDLVPSDFFLFDHLRHLLAGRVLSHGEALVEAVKAVLAGIEQGTLERVFLERMERLRRCIEILICEWDTL